MLWRWGDGDGGALKHLMTQAFDAAGLREAIDPYIVDESTTEHILYRFYDIESVLLYIGITAHPYKRWEQHEKRKPWFSQVAVITRSVLPDFESAVNAERHAIRNERPKYNIAHNGGGAR